MIKKLNLGCGQNIRKSNENEKWTNMDFYKNKVRIIRGSHFSCGVSYRDPTHKRYFSYFTFEYFCNTEDYYKRKESNLFYIKRRKLNFTRFAFTSLNKIFNPLINTNPEIYGRFFCWMPPCSEALFKLEVRK